MGRHRQFDLEKALDTALCIFWKKGYEGTSYADLTAAIGVERPALYAAFGNKESLFRKVLARYYEHYMDFIPVALSKPTAREVAEHLIYNAIDLNTRYEEHLGCLGINGALAVSKEAESIRLALIEARAEGEAKLRQRFDKAKAAGDLAADSDTVVLTQYLLAVTHGLAVQAKAGFSRAQLRAIAKQAMSNWPSGEAISA